MNGIGSGVRVLADQVALRASDYLGALGPCTLLEGYLSMVHSSSRCWSSDRPLSSLILCASDRGSRSVQVDRGNICKVSRVSGLGR